ncbi:hypothetical protein PM16_46 [Proteus phage PM16]|uniref:Uncharacterized protein n=1 Tax=Proteus phage PM16 TaxID=1357704 RepID=A0A0A6ZKC6_9CAUD|nr:hypothetical protein ACQ55_gp46 [Proteus phage PM16]AGZ17290.1 hypothetical protein PM16_46 [Proteus phage PM16]
MCGHPSPQPSLLSPHRVVPRENKRKGGGVLSAVIGAVLADVTTAVTTAVLAGLMVR